MPAAMLVYARYRSDEMHRSCKPIRGDDDTSSQRLAVNPCRTTSIGDRCFDDAAASRVRRISAATIPSCSPNDPISLAVVATSWDLI
jgi:hypothetical protein